MYLNASLLNNAGNDFRVWSLFFGVSAICHFIAFIIVITAPVNTHQRSFVPSVINVDLVSIPTQRPAGTVKDITSVRQKKKKVVQSSSKNAVTIDKKTSTKKKAKKSLKKKTYKSSKVVDSAIRNIEKKVEDSRPDHLDRVFDRLRGKVEKDAFLNNGRLPSGRGLSGKRAITRLEIYNAEIFSLIQKNWALPLQFAGRDAELETKIGMKIMPDGEIRDIWFDKKSGDGSFDDQAEKAVLKSNPLPSLPPEFTEPYYEIGLRFTPSGLK